MNWSSNAAITLTLLFSGAMMGAELKPDTEHAWQDYLAGADRRMTDRTQGNFLWVDESDDLLRRVRAGEIVVSPIQPAMPIAVPHGLVHHWIGASFLPGAQMNEVIARLRDYDRYGDVYAPTVKEVQVLQRSSHSDQARDDFVLTLVNQSFFSKRAIEDESSSTYVRLDARRWYALSHSVRIQEWAGYGTSKQQKLRVGEGSGYVWNVATISRFEERDGGVYFELEAIALSRDVPARLRFLVDPIIRRISRTTLATSLDRTRQALDLKVESAALKDKVGGS